MRAVFFGVLVVIPVDNFFLDSNNCVVFTLLNGLPRLSFYTSFSLLLFYWIEIIYIKQGGSFLWKRPFFLGNFFLYCVQVTIWLLIFLDTQSVIDIPLLENYFFAGLSLIMALLFLNIGGKLFFILKNFKPSSKDLNNRIFEVGSVTCIATTCFIFRTTFLFLTTYIKPWDRIVYILFSYYLSVEIIPIGLVLLVLNREPNDKDESNSSDTESIVPHTSGDNSGSIDEIIYKPFDPTHTQEYRDCENEN